MGESHPSDDQGKTIIVNKNKANGHAASIVPLPRQRKHGVRASDIEPADVQWLNFPYEPMGELIVIGGPGGVGKGLFLADRAARITTGAKWPLSSRRAPLGNVIWCEAEDKLAPTIIPRLIAAGADMDRVTLYTGQQAEEFYKEVKRSDIIRDNVRMLVLSPLLSFLPGLAESNSELDVRRNLSPLEELVAETMCGVYGIMHINKKSDQTAIQRLGGSVAFGNVVRAAMVLRAEENNTTRVGHIKHNLAFKGEDMLFTKVHRKPEKPKSQYIGIDWSEAKETVSDDTFFDKRKDENKETAAAWLERTLTEKGKLAVEDLEFLADTSGHNWEAVRKAKLRNPRIKHDIRGKGEARKTLWWIA